MSNKDYGEVLLQSTEQIVDSKLSMVKFDQTIICTITDDSNAFNGEYQVSDGSVTFTAYSENRNYMKNMQVYVLIPQGNWANRKQITSLYSKSENAIIHKRRKDDLVIIDSQKKVGSMEYLTTYHFFTNYNISTDLANTLYFTFKIKTNLPDNYEFYIKVDFVWNEDNNSESKYFTNKEMIGNSSYYFTPVQQEFICPINFNKNKFINRIKLELQNDKQDFSDLEEKGYFINIDEVTVHLCHDISSYENNSVLIFPVNLTDKYNTNDNLSQNMKLIWVNKDKNGKYIGFDGEFDKEKGKGVEVDNGIIINGYDQIDSEAGKNYYWIDWYYDTINKRLKLEDPHIGDEKDECLVNLLAKFTNTNVQAKVWKNGKSYDSNVFTFKNIKPDELIADSLLRIYNGINISATSATPPKPDDNTYIENNPYEVYYIYPTLQGGTNIGQLIKFAPGQNIKLLNYTVYDKKPTIKYTLEIRTGTDENGKPIVETKDGEQELFENSYFRYNSIDLINNQTLRITLNRQPPQGSFSLVRIQLINISSLCLTTENQSKHINVLDETDVYNRLAEAEARIQQLEKQLSAYI